MAGRYLPKVVEELPEAGAEQPVSLATWLESQNAALRIKAAELAAYNAELRKLLRQDQSLAKLPGRTSARY